MGGGIVKDENVVILRVLVLESAVQYLQLLIQDMQG